MQTNKFNTSIPPMSARNAGYGQAYTVKTEDPYAGQSTSEASSSQETPEYSPFALTSTAIPPAHSPSLYVYTGYSTGQSYYHATGVLNNTAFPPRIDGKDSLASPQEHQSSRSPYAAHDTSRGSLVGTSDRNTDSLTTSSAGNTFGNNSPAIASWPVDMISPAPIYDRIHFASPADTSLSLPQGYMQIGHPTSERSHAKTSMQEPWSPSSAYMESPSIVQASPMTSAGPFVFPTSASQRQRSHRTSRTAGSAGSTFLGLSGVPTRFDQQVSDEESDKVAYPDWRGSDPATYNNGQIQARDLTSAMTKGSHAYANSTSRQDYYPNNHLAGSSAHASEEHRWYGSSRAPPSLTQSPSMSQLSQAQSFSYPAAAQLPTQSSVSQSSGLQYPQNSTAHPVFSPIHYSHAQNEQGPLFPIPATTIDPPTAFLIQGFIASPNRYALGERKVVIHTPRVGQKSYGHEKRFLCPPPVATLVGRGWWTKTGEGLYSPPQINISMTNENPAPNSYARWTTTFNRETADQNERVFAHGESPFLGKVTGKSLHISDGAEKKAKASVQAHVTIMAANPGSESGYSAVGVFESKPINIVSKPSKKRVNVKSSDLFLQHGTPVSLYNRIRSQTSSTKHLSVATDITQIPGSDGRPVLVQSAVKPTVPAFIADPVSWQPLLIWLIDPSGYQHPASPAMRTSSEGFPAPADAIAAPITPTAPLIHYNHLIRLQCPATGLTSPVMIVRRVANGATAYGGDGTNSQVVLGHCLAGELPGEPVSQLQKIALELYQTPVPSGVEYNASSAGQWLCAEKERIEFQAGKAGRVSVDEAASNVSPNPASSSALSREKHSDPPTPVDLTVGLPFGYGPSSQGNYPSGSRPSGFIHSSGSHAGVSSPYGQSANLPRDSMSESNGPGPIRRKRTNSSSGYVTRSTLDYATSPTTTMRPLHTMSNDVAASSRWSTELLETATWTIVGAETQTYTFWVSSDLSLGSPITPLPTISRCLPPGQVAENDRHGIMTSLSTKPQATFYGSGFGKDNNGDSRYTIWWGTEPAEENEFRCDQVMAAAVPRASSSGNSETRRPITLVRNDGKVIIPTGLTWRQSG